LRRKEFEDQLRANYHKSMALAERLRASVANAPFSVPDLNLEISITTSIGLTVPKRASDSPAAALRRSDGALYVATNATRNMVIVGEQAMLRAIAHNT
jgi:PleD family two-component response regulator